MTYEEKIEAAALNSANSDAYAGPTRSFVAGAQWCRDNPPPEVMGLVDALLKAYDEILGCAGHKLPDTERMIKSALEAFEKRGGRG